MRNANKYLKVCNKVTSVLNTFTRIFNGVYINKVNIFVEDEDNEDELYQVNFELEVDASRSETTWVIGREIIVKVEGEYDDIIENIYESIIGQTDALDTIQTEMLNNSLKRILSIKK